MATKQGGGDTGLDLGNLKEVLNEKVSMEMFNTLTVQKANKIDIASQKFDDCLWAT